MPTFTIRAEFDLTSEVEPEVNSGSFDNGNVDYDEYEDNSYFQSEQVRSSGGDLTFKVEADDEDAARELASEVIHDGQEYEDRNGLTWLIDSVEIEVEEVEAEMTKEKAVELVRQFIETQPDGETKEAFRFLLNLFLGVSQGS